MEKQYLCSVKDFVSSILLKMKACFFILAMLSSLILYGQNASYNIVTNPDVESSDAYRNGNPYQRDFLLFADMLENTHPIFKQASKLHYDMDSLIYVGYRYLDSCKNGNMLQNYLQSLLSPLNDGHSGVAMDLHGEVFPFKYFADSDTAFYLTGITRDFSNELGHRIFSINGKPVGEIMESFRPSMSCDNNNYFKANVNNRMQFKNAWVFHPHKRPDDMLQFLFDDGNSVMLPPVKKSELDMVWHRPKKHNVPFTNNGMPFSYHILQEKQLCCLHFSTCIDRNTLRMYEMLGMSVGMTEEQIAQVPDFGLFLREMFSEMNRQGVNTLVIDVRDNSGGNSWLCDQLLSWLKPIEETSRISSLMRVSRLWESQYPDLMETFKGTLTSQGKPYLLGEMYEADLVETELGDLVSDLFLMNHCRDSLFAGNVIFMQGKDTFSSAGELITTAIDNGIGIVIGDNGVYSPQGYGDLLFWELPNTHTQGFVSHKIFMRPDATKHNEDAIIPDITLPETWDDAHNGIDPCWKWVLDNYGDK